MPGRIRNDDIALVRDKSRIDEVVREHVALKSAGSSLKGLCPFHDEKTPSFHVTPSKGFWYCFGCGEGGDVFSFIQKVEHSTFSEAVEKLANKYNISLRYEENYTNPNTGQRSKVLEANKLASEFYQNNLESPEAEIGRKFLKERGFDKNSAQLFNIGYANKNWDNLTKFLKQKGFTEQELVFAGLSITGQKGTYDRFRGRLIWPIKDASGEVVGFGARRLFDDDQGPKYLNTPETLVYKKSQVLYGLDQAKKEITSKKQVVIVEGYTDVMACHLSGVKTAVATCGTAFGEDHARILRRFLMDEEQFTGEIIYTFDGDEAGQKAALKAFNLDQTFSTRTFVAIEKNGLDPCDLRQKSGNDAIVALIASKVPLFEFVIKNAISKFDLNNAEGRVLALKAAAPIVSNIKDKALKPEYVRLLAGWLGIEINSVEQAVKDNNRQIRTVAVAPQNNQNNKENIESSIEKEALKLIFQFPLLVSEWIKQINVETFTQSKFRELFEVLEKIVVSDDLISKLLEENEDEEFKNIIAALSVEDFKAIVDKKYVDSIFARLLELSTSRTIADLKSQLQRLEPETNSKDHDKMFQDLLELEEYRRALREKALGTS
ncbi:MAG: DNA primase [Actinomycetes bacterium]